MDRPILRADVVAVGYGNSEEHILVVRNSWGDGWGIKGYLSLAFGYLTERGLSADFWSIRSVG